MDPDASLSEIAEAVQELATRHMPYGKYGPSHYPPSGLLLCDLPFEYLRWLRRKGFPPGRNGQLLALLYQLKLDGAEDIFKIIRSRTSADFSRKKSRRLDFPEE